MSLAVVGMLITDATFISTAKYSRVLPGGMWFLIVGPLVDGCLGSKSGLVPHVQSVIANAMYRLQHNHGRHTRIRCGYIRACRTVRTYVKYDTIPADPLNSARMFSLLIGLMFTGMSIGPTLGSVLINRTHNVLIVFYIATAVHIVYACLIWFVVPESLAPMQMQQARKLHEDALRTASVTKKKALFKRVFSFLEPLTLLLPASVGPPKGGNPLKKQRGDWSLFLLALANGCVLLLIVSPLRCQLLGDHHECLSFPRDPSLQICNT